MKTIDIQWKEFNIDLPSVKAQVDELIPGKCFGISANSVMQIHLDDSVSDEDVELIKEYVDGLDEESPEATEYAARAQREAIKKQVANISAFTQQLMIDFNSENIAMGITADNMTEEVLDVMLPVMSALQGGAPTVAIKRAKAIPESSYDSKYMTEARLLAYVNRIEAFLGLPQSESL